jgi:predicted nucleic acid-binding protein
MILTDTGPLVALLDKRDPYHHACVSAALNLTGQVLLTTWPCFTEAMYFLGAAGGFSYQQELWLFRTQRQLILHDLTSAEIGRMAVLMEKYKDRPMDLADASLISLAESHSMRQIFSLDNDFRFYCLSDGSVLDVIPEKTS